MLLILSPAAGSAAAAAHAAAKSAKPAATTAAPAETAESTAEPAAESAEASAERSAESIHGLRRRRPRDRRRFAIDRTRNKMMMATGSRPENRDGFGSRRPGRARRQRDAAPFGDAIDDPRGAGQQSAAVVAFAEARQDVAGGSRLRRSRRSRTPRGRSRPRCGPAARPSPAESAGRCSGLLARCRPVRTASPRTLRSIPDGSIVSTVATTTASLGLPLQRADAPIELLHAWPRR